MPSFVKDRIAQLEREKTLSNIYAIIQQSGEDRPAAQYLDSDEVVTIHYPQYHQMALGYAAYLREALAAPKGRFVAIQLDTCPQWYAVFWGLVMAGYCPLLLDFTLTDEMTAYLLGQADAAGVVGTKVRRLPQRYRQVLLPDLATAPPCPQGFSADFADSMALCTSGTTATSRIFVYSGEAVSNQVLNSDLLYDLNPFIITDRHANAAAFLPLHHVFGFMVNLMWIPFVGYTNIYFRDRTPTTLIKTCNQLKVNLVCAVPLLVNNLSVGLSKNVAKQPPVKRSAFYAMKSLSLALQRVAPKAGLTFARRVLFKGILPQLLGPHIQCIILGGGHTPKEHMRTMSALGYYTVCGFGMTETAVTSVETTLNLKKRVSGSVGLPLKSAQYHVLPTNLKRPSFGEMLIRGTTIHTGRLVDGKLAEPDVDRYGWYPTGDIVRLGKSGMWIEGRSKDVIIGESGENVYPDEIEDTFAGIQGVEQLCVLGTARRDKTPYEHITLVLNIGENYNNEAYLEELMRNIGQINSRLPIIKKLGRVLLTPEKLPLVNGIKVKRLALKQMIQGSKIAYRDMDLKGATAAVIANEKAVESPVVENVVPENLQLEEIKAKVRHIFGELLQLPADSIGDSAHFVDDLGGDSLQSLGIALKVEELFAILIPVEEYGRCVSVDDLSALIYALVQGHGAYESDTPRDTRLAPLEPVTTFEDSKEFKLFAQREQELLSVGNPYFVCHESPLSDVSLMDGQQVLNFGSYNYAGMSGRKEVSEAAKAAIDKYGTSASGSRLLAGEKALYQELEQEIAAWKHTEDALVLVGGHSTNVTFVGNFCGKNDLIVYDAIAHNSVEQGCRLSGATAKPFPHNDYHALEGILKVQRHKFEKVLIIVEGAYSMDGDIAPIPAFVQLKKTYGCFLMVDEAHSACVIGHSGGGVDEYFNLQPEDIDIKMGTLSKGLGACGGYLAGKRSLIQYLRYQLPGFVFSVGISPPLAAAALAAIRLLREDEGIMANMRRNIETFLTEAHRRNLNTCLAGGTAIVPVLVGRDEDAFLLSNLLRRRGVFVPPAVYPAVPKNKARLRFCVIADHKPEQIEQALDTLVEVAQEAHIALPGL